MKIDNTQQDIGCRLCKERDETVNHSTRKHTKFGFHGAPHMDVPELVDQPDLTYINFVRKTCRVRWLIGWRERERGREIRDVIATWCWWRQVSAQNLVRLQLVSIENLFPLHMSIWMLLERNESDIKKIITLRKKKSPK